MNRPIVAVTMGDPAGIGPEVVWGAFADPSVHAACRPLVVADARVMERASALLPANPALRRIHRPSEAAFATGVMDCLHLDLLGEAPPFGRIDPAAGEAAYRCVERAVELALEGEVDAVCTAPLSKEALNRAGRPFPGHTELLASLTGAPQVAMMLACPRLRVVHVTTHVGLVEAVRRIRPERVLAVVRLGADALRRAGLPRPRLGVCALNPHAGEHGLFGEGEEEAVILPAVRAAQAEGIDAQGPFPADTLFARAARGAFDLVVAMYHDQGHIPVKVLGFGNGVNVTLGLPIVRTSPDHGTAFDIAGTGRADPGGMRAAVLAAAEYARRRGDP